MEVELSLNKKLHYMGNQILHYIGINTQISFDWKLIITYNKLFLLIFLVKLKYNRLISSQSFNLIFKIIKFNLCLYNPLLIENF